MTRRILIGLAALLAVLAAAGAVLVASFDPNGQKDRIADAVRRATGRELTLAGPLRLRWSLAPAIEARDVRLANLPGGSRPEMVRVARAEVEVALLPLLSRRVELRRLVLVGPDVLLETVDGRPNWRFGPEPPAPPGPAPSDPAPSAPANEARTQVLLQHLRIEDGRVAWRAPSGQTITASVPRLSLDAPDGAPTRLAGELAVQGVPVTVQGTTGPLAGLGGADPWPVALTASGAGAQLSANGALGPGASLRIEARADDLAALGPALGVALPPLRAVQAEGQVGPDGLGSLALRVGASDLGAGVRIEAFEARAPALDQPVQVAGTAALGGTPLRVSGTVGSLAALRGGGPAPVDLALEGAGATLGLRGTVPVSAAPGGLDLAVTARVPDLAAFAAPGRPLPPLRDVALDARLSDPAGLRQGVALRALRLVLPQGDLAGDVAVTYAPRPALRGTLVSQRVDVDALLAALRAAPAAAPAPAPAQPAPEPPARTRLIPDTPLPFEALRWADADLRLTVGEAVLGGVAYRGVETRLALAEGRLRLDPFGMQAPGGRVEGQASADAGQAPPPVALTLRAPGLALGPLLAAFGVPDGASGTLDLDADLRGAGTTPRAIAAALSGHLGAALVDGELDSALIDRLLGGVLRGANIPVNLEGRNKLRCLALRADAAGGVAEVRTLLLDTTRLRLEGDGRVNLADETLDLQLRPLLRLGGTGVSLAVRVGGTLLAPKVDLDKLPGQAGRLGLLLGGLAPQPEEDGCGPQLAAARGGQAGPAPSATDAGGQAPRPLRPADLLRGLLR